MENPSHSVCCAHSNRKISGGLSSFTAPELGGKLWPKRAASGAEGKHVDEAILGNVVQAGIWSKSCSTGSAEGRLRSARCGDDDQQGLRFGIEGRGAGGAGRAAWRKRNCGGWRDGSMSNCPYLLPQARTGYRLGDGKLVDSMIWDGLWDAYENFHMGNTGELVAEKYKINREEQDKFALESHQKAIQARKSCFFEAQSFRSKCRRKRVIPS